MSDAFAKAMAAATAVTGQPAPKAQPSAPAPTPQPPATTPSASAESPDSTEPAGSAETAGAGPADSGAPHAEAAAGLTSAQIKELIETGKLSDLADRVGADRSKVTEVGGRLRRATKLEHEATAKAAAAEAKLTEASTKLTQLDEKIARGNARFAAAVALEGAAASQDWTSFAKGLERYLPEGMTFGKLTQLVAQGVIPRTPTEERLARELADIKAQIAPKPETPEAKRTRDVATLVSKLTAHPGAALDGFAESVHAELAKDWDPGLKSYRSGSGALKKAADAVYAREKARAEKILGKPKPTAAPRAALPQPPRVRDSNGQYVAPQTATERDSFKEAFAAAQRAASAAVRNR